MADFGLSKSTSDIEGADLYQTQNGSKIYLFNCDDNRLPPAIEQGSTLREVTWGVENAQDLEDLAARLADVDGFKRTENTVQCLDPNGMTIRFEQSFVKKYQNLKRKVLTNTATFNV